MQNEMLFVIVLYKEKLQETQTYKTLIQYYSDVPLFIYDNSPYPQHSCSEFKENIHYVSDINNSGLSAAYNCAACYAGKMGYSWILLLDQDTTFCINILDEYYEVMNKYSEIKLIVPPMKVNNEKYMSPVRVSFHMATLSKSVPLGKTSLYQYSPINSGMAINVEAFRQVGGYNEKVKLDFSDLQFVERFRKLYPNFYVLNHVCFQHFSSMMGTKQQKLQRFGIFCDSLKNCDREDVVDSLSYFFLVIKRMLSLILQTRCLRPISIVYSKYF